MPAHSGPHHGLHYGYNQDENGWGTNMTADLKRVDALLTRKVASRTLSTPPGSPSDGDRYIVAANPTGYWLGHTGHIALYDGLGAAWLFYAPEAGWDVYCVAEGRTLAWNGASWGIISEVDASRFTTVQAALDAASAAGGGIVRLPPGTLDDTTTPSLTWGLTIPANVTLRGQGKKSTYLKLGTLTNPGAEYHDFIVLEGAYSGLEDMTVWGPGNNQYNSGTGRLVVLRAPSADLGHQRLRRLEILDAASYGLAICGTEETGHVCVSPFIEDVSIWNIATKGCVFLGGGVSGARFKGCQFNARTALNLSTTEADCNIRVAGAVGFLFEACGIEGWEDASHPDVPYVLFDKTGGDLAALSGRFLDCWFENGVGSGPGHTAHFIKLLNGAVVNVIFDGCHVVRCGGTSAPKGGKFLTNVAGATTLHNGIRMRNCLAYVDGDPTAINLGDGNEETYPDNKVVELDMGPTTLVHRVTMEDCIALQIGIQANHRPWVPHAARNYAMMRQNDDYGLSLAVLGGTEWQTLHNYHGPGTLICHAGSGGPGDHGSGLYFLGDLGGGYGWYYLAGTKL